MREGVTQEPFNLFLLTLPTRFMPLQSSFPVVRERRLSHQRHGTLHGMAWHGIGDVADVPGIVVCLRDMSFETSRAPSAACLEVHMLCLPYVGTFSGYGLLSYTMEHSDPTHHLPLPYCCAIWGDSGIHDLFLVRAVNSRLEDE